MAGRGGALARSCLLVPLATLTLAIALALVAIASIVLNKVIDNIANGEGSRYNRLSPTLQWFQVLACALAFAAVLTTFCHTKTYRASSRYVSGSHSWLAFFVTSIPFGLGIKAICIGGLDALNWVTIILTWCLLPCLFLLGLLLHTPLNDTEPLDYDHHRRSENLAQPGVFHEKGLPYNTSPAGAPGYNRELV